MNHSILSSPSNLRKRPTDAADYVLGNEDWTKEQRFAPPMILSGSRDQFIEAAGLVRNGPAYLSTTLSDQGVIDAPKIRYCSDLYSAHYLAGIPREDIGELSVLHRKPKGWDAHKLSSVAIRGSGNKARFLRPVADYLRFAWLTSFINRLFGWGDPLDPQNYCPIHICQSWREKPEIIVRIGQEIAAGFHDDQIHRREDILRIIRRNGLNPIADDRQIDVEIDSQRWSFVGYAATAHADAPEKLMAHRGRTTKPFSDVRDHPFEIRERLLSLYHKRVQENADYYGIKTLEAATGLIFPDPTYCKNHYEKEDAERTCAEPSAKLDRAGDPQLPAVAETILCRDRGTDRRNQNPQGELYISGKTPGGVGETAVDVGRNRPCAEGQNPPSQNAAESDGGGDSDYGNRARKHLRELEEARRGIEQWIGLIIRLLKIPRWLRQHRANQKKQAEKFLKEFGVKPRPVPKRIRTILRNAAAVHFPHYFGQPETVKPTPAGPAGPKTQEIVPNL